MNNTLKTKVWLEKIHWGKASVDLKYMRTNVELKHIEEKQMLGWNTLSWKTLRANVWLIENKQTNVWEQTDVWEQIPAEQ